MNGISSNYSNYGSLFTGSSSASASKNIFSLSQELNTSSRWGYGVNNSSLSPAQSNSVVSFKSTASNLQSAVDKILTKKNDGTSVFGGYKATSANSDVLTASYKNDASKYSSEALEARRNPNYVAKAPQDVAIKTVQLATTQKNTGTALESRSMDLEKNKTYRFEISDGDKTTNFAFVTENGDTNESSQKKMAQAINDKNIGVKASVVTNGQTGKSSLVLESTKTGLKDGQAKSFEIKDSAGYDAVSKIGAGNVTQNAQNAQYYIGKVDAANSTATNVVLQGDAQLKTSQSNDAKIDDRTTVTLKKTSDSYVKVGFEKDGLGGVNAARDLVNGFNGLFENALSNSDNRNSARLATQLSGAAQTYAKSLSDIGISRNENGYLVIDEAKMKKASENGTLQNFFTSESKGSSYGFTNKLDVISKSVSDNPTQYVEASKESEESSGGSNVWESETSPASSYSKLYFNMQKYESMGSLFNSMF